MTGSRKRLAFFCATFLRPEMHHIYRQIRSVQNYESLVLTQKRQEIATFPFDPIWQIPKPWTRNISRWREKRTGIPWQISSAEARKILHILEKEKVALLHIFFGNVAVHMLPLLRAWSKPLVVSFHGADVAGTMRSPEYHPALQEVFARSTVIAVRSQALGEAVAQLECPDRKILLQPTVLPPITPTSHLPPADGAWKWLQASRLIPKKGLGNTLRAFAEFRKQWPQATLTLAGEGPEETALRELAASMGIQSAVHFAGFLDQEKLTACYRSHHGFLHPSESVGGDVEGVPNALLEAMAHGLPVVATRHGGIPEVITHEESGLLISEGSTEELAQAMQRLAEDSALYGKLVTEGPAAVQRRHGPGSNDAFYAEVEARHTAGIPA